MAAHVLGMTRILLEIVCKRDLDSFAVREQHLILRSDRSRLVALVE